MFLHAKSYPFAVQNLFFCILKDDVLHSKSYAFATLNGIKKKTEKDKAIVIF